MTDQKLKKDETINPVVAAVTGAVIGAAVVAGAVAVNSKDEIAAALKDDKEKIIKATDAAKNSLNSN